VQFGEVHNNDFFDQFYPILRIKDASSIRDTTDASVGKIGTIKVPGIF